MEEWMGCLRNRSRSRRLGGDKHIIKKIVIAIRGVRGVDGDEGVRVRVEFEKNQIESNRIKSNQTKQQRKSILSIKY